jgi:Domain of unknown function (DUF4281)
MMERLFALRSVVVLPLWVLMIVLPHWRWTQRIVQSPLISAAPAALYAALVVPRLGEVWPAVANPKLSEVAALLGSSAGATMAWVHFLAFDLLVGRWMYLDSRERQISAWLMAPVRELAYPPPISGVYAWD